MLRICAEHENGCPRTVVPGSYLCAPHGVELEDGLRRLGWGPLLPEQESEATTA